MIPRIPPLNLEVSLKNTMDQNSLEGFMKGEISI